MQEQSQCHRFAIVRTCDARSVHTSVHSVRCANQSAATATARNSSMADAAEDRTWLFDSVLGFLRGPGWCLPVMGFIDDNCVVFDTEEENKLSYMEIYTAFREMADSLLELHLEEYGISAEQFA